MGEEIEFRDIAVKLIDLPANLWKYSTEDITPKDSGGRVTLFRYSTSLKGFDFNLDREHKQTSRACYDAAGEPDGQSLVNYNAYRLTVMKGRKSIVQFDNKRDVVDSLYEDIHKKVSDYKREKSEIERKSAVSRLLKVIGERNDSR
jgi:hypothetical protein